MFDMKELILEGLVYTIMGIVIVFAMLVVIMLVIKAMQFVSGEKAPAKKETPAPVKEEASAPVITQSPSNDNNEELIAVITAAIAAAMGKSSSGLVIKSYKKISGSEWNKIGRREALENRF